MFSHSVDLNKIFFKTETYDPSTNYPVYIFDSTALPNPNNCNFQSVIDSLVQRIPDTRYVLVFFTAGLSNDPQFSINHKGHPSAGKNVDNGDTDSDATSSAAAITTFSWVWGVKAFKSISKEKRRHLRKIYIVHESWWIRALTEVLKNLISSKFMNSKQKKVLHINNLSELSKHLDITKLNISLANYYYEFHNNSENDTLKSNKNKNRNRADSTSVSEINEINMATKIIVPIHLQDVFGIPFYENQLSWYYYNLIFFKINQMFYFRINENVRHLILFHNNSPNIIFQSDLIKDAVSRNQLITLDEFDIYPLINIWKFFLKNLNGFDSLLPVDLLLKRKFLIESETLSHTNELLLELLKFNNLEVILNDLMNFFLIPIIYTDMKLLNDDSNYTYKLLKFLIKFLCGSDIAKVVSNHDKKLISIFIKNLLIYWPFLDSNNLKIQKNIPAPPPSRKKNNNSTAMPAQVQQQITSTLQNFELYININNLILDNERLLSDDEFLISRLQDAKHLNNFNVLSNSHQLQAMMCSSPTFQSFGVSVDSTNEDRKKKFPNFKDNFKNLLSNYSSSRSGSNINLIDDAVSVSSDEISSVKNNHANNGPNSNQAVLKKKLPKLPPRSMTSNFEQHLLYMQKPIPPQLPDRQAVALTQSEENLILSNQDPYGSISEYGNNNESTSSLGLENMTLNNANVPARLANRGNGHFHNNSSSTISSLSNGSSASLSNIGFPNNNITITSTSSSSLPVNAKGIAPPPIPAKAKPKLLIKKKTLEEQKFILQDKKKYAGIEGGKVVKLAQLFEERLESIHILDEIQVNE